MIWNIFLLALMALTAATQWRAQIEYDKSFGRALRRMSSGLPGEWDVRRHQARVLWWGCLAFNLVLMCMFV